MARVATKARRVLGGQKCATWYAYPVLAARYVGKTGITSGYSWGRRVGVLQLKVYRCTVVVVARSPRWGRQPENLKKRIRKLGDTTRAAMWARQLRRAGTHFDMAYPRVAAHRRDCATDRTSILVSTATPSFTLAGSAEPNRQGHLACVVGRPIKAKHPTTHWPTTVGKPGAASIHRPASNG